MSVVRTELTLKNEADAICVEQGLIKEDEIRQMTVEAIVDTGAWALVINDETRKKLGLRDTGVGEGTRVNCVDDADGQKAEYPMAGPLEVWWKNRHLICEALGGAWWQPPKTRSVVRCNGTL